MTKSTLPLEVEQLANRFFTALEEGSIEGVLACYHRDARIWHNFDKVAMTPEESLSGVRTLFLNFPGRKYVNVQRLPTHLGFVQQHSLMLKRLDGVMIDWPGCLIVKVNEDLITRLDEYVDLATLTGA